MIKAIIFDCFGVLAEDGWTPFKRKYIASDAKLTQEVADLGKQTDRGMLEPTEMINEVSKLVGVDVRILREAVGRRVPNEDLFDYIKRELKPIYKIGLMTNANYDVLDDLFLPEQAQLFDASVMSHEAKLVKPDPAIYRLMAERLGVGMSECVFIDDQEHYCVAAEEVGMSSIVYVSPEQIRQELEAILKH